MTGFGAGRAKADEEEISVELKSLNHKFCEVKLRLPRELASLEGPLTKLVKDRVARGSVDVSFKRQSATASGAVPTVDVGLAREYRRALAEVAAAIGAEGPIRLQDVAFQPGVIRMEERDVNVDHALAAATTAMQQALAALEKMREVEGEAIRADLDARIGKIDQLASELRALAPRAVEEYQRRLTDRIAELSRGVAVDAQRLAQEVAVFAERSDVAEEMTRLSSHLAQFRALLASPEPAGRKMDFLVQEMHREVNTTGSKSQHTEIASRIVTLKAELERIREQVQNVE